MEELQPEDIEDLLQELEEESGAQESVPQEIEELLRVLQSGSEHLDRREAAVKLGRVETSNPRIVRALIAAYESDPYSMINRAAAKSLRAPVHQAYLQEHPDLMEATERALQQPAGSDPSRVPTVRPEAERILFQVEDETSRHKWYTGSLVLEPAAGTITISGYRDGGPAISIPVSEIVGCEVVAMEEVRDRTQAWYDSGEPLGCLLVGFIAIIQHSLLKASLVPAIKLTQSMSDGARKQRAVHLRSVERGDRGQVATAEMAHRIAAFLRQSGYDGVIPDELSEPTEFEASLREKRRGGLLLSVAALSSLAGLVVGLVTGVWRAEQSLSPGGGLGCGAGFLVALAVGAVVGAVVGAAVTWRKDRIAGMIMGAISAAVIASLSWLPIALWRVAEVSGPLFRW
jgi:hypothetical protein